MQSQSPHACEGDDAAAPDPTTMSSRTPDVSKPTSRRTSDTVVEAVEETTLLLRAPAGEQKPTPLLCSSERWKRWARIGEGVTYLVIVAVIWVAAASLVQYIYSDLKLNVPFFLTYVCNSEFIFLLPLRFARERYLPNGCWRGCRRDGQPLLSPAAATDWRRAAVAGALVCPLWFLAQGSYNWSLGGTSVSSSTVLSTTSCVFTFVLSLLLLREGFTWLKLAGVLINVTGAVLVSYSDTSAAATAGNTWWGDALALFSACMYAAYTTAIRRLVPDDGSVNISVFFGFLGLFNAILLAPMVVGLHFGNVENLTTLTPFFVGCMLVKGLFDNVVSDLLWARAIQLTSPTLATVALTLTIPLAMLSDVFIARDHLQPLMIVGALIVATGFVVTTLAVQPDTMSAATAAEVTTASINSSSATGGTTASGAEDFADSAADLDVDHCAAAAMPAASCDPAKEVTSAVVHAR